MNIKNIKDLLIKGKLKEAIDSITPIAEGSEYESVIIIIHQTFENLNRESMAGLLTMEAERTEKARITDRILKLSKDLEQSNSISHDKLRIIPNPNNNLDKRLAG
jgi:Effector-associated domain 11